MRAKGRSGTCMAYVSPTLPSDGTTADASDISTPINQIVTQVNGNLDSTNLADNAVTTAKIVDANVTTAKIADAAVTNAKLSTAAGEVGGAWKTWTPTWTNATGTTAYAKYMQVGKTVIFKARLNVTGAFTGTVSVSLPVTAAALTDTDDILLSTCRYMDAGTAYFLGSLRYATTTTVIPTANVGMNDVNATTPHTWANTDKLIIEGAYEAA